jgi:membrane protein DedA with SNARE-associated domain
MFTLSGLVLLLTKYKYLLLFPLAIIEGPIITVIAGFFVTLGLLNPVLVYVVVVFGDMVGDSFLYMVGRGGGTAVRKIFRRPVNTEKLEKAKKYFDANRDKALIMSKIVHGLGISGLVAAGSLRISYRKFFVTCTLVSMVQSGILLLVGILFGHAYKQINQYLGYFGIVTLIVGVLIIVFFIIRYKTRPK